MSSIDDIFTRRTITWDAGDACTPCCFSSRSCDLALDYVERDRVIPCRGQLRVYYTADSDEAKTILIALKMTEK